VKRHGQLGDADTVPNDFERRVNAHQMPRGDKKGVTPRLRLEHPSNRSSVEGHSNGVPLHRRGRGIRPAEIPDGDADRRTLGYDAYVGCAATETRMRYSVRVDEVHGWHVSQGFHELHDGWAFPKTEEG
jgi:hypothetical protein